jgi:hypothetical protein
MQTRLLGGFLRFRVLVSRASLKSGPCAPDCTHVASLPDYRQPINRAGYALARNAILHLDAIAGFMAFSESEQSKNKVGEMMPLYAARVQDLGPDDVAVFKCGACGHTAELWQGNRVRSLW